MLESIISLIKRFFYFFIKNDNKAIRYTSVTVVCLAIVGASYLSFDTAKEVQEKGKILIKDGAEIAHQEAKKTKDFLSQELEQKEKIADPMENFQQNLGKVDGNISKIIVATEEAKSKLEGMIQNNDFASLEKKVQNLTYDLIDNRKKKVNELFEGIFTRIPAFVEIHYDDRDKKEIFIEAMNKELFTQDELETFLYNTATELDAVLYNAVNEELDGLLKYMEASIPNMTFNELKKRMPDARTICESVYAKMNNQNLTAKQISEAGRSWESVELKHGPVSKGAFVAVTGFLATAAAVGAAAVAITNPISLIGIAILGTVATGIATYEVAVIREGALRERHKNFEKELKVKFIETRDNFKVQLENAMLDILKNYTQLDFFKNAVIEVNPNYTVPAMQVELVSEKE